LEQGLSLPQIGELVGRPAPTVGYWVSKYGLVANGRDKYTPRGALDAQELEELIEHGLTLQRIAKELNVSEWTVRYWIERYKLPRPAEIRREHILGALRTRSAKRYCPHHGTAELFVDRLGHRAQCKQCRSEAVARRRRKVKRILVDEAGGKCARCGYDRCQAALQFHHLDPASKSFGIAGKGFTRSIDELRAEASKCILLCANCHAEVEAGLVRLKDAV
jgi:predicted transcriptional regulator